MNRGEGDLVYLRNPWTTNLSLHPTIFYHFITFFLLMHHAYVSDDAAAPKLTLTHFPAILLSFAFPHQTPLTHTLSHFTHLSIPPVSHSPPALTRNTQHLVPICPCALCKEVAALSRGAPAPLFPAHAPRHPAREAKAQSLIWWPGLTAAKAQIQSGGLCECVVTPPPS